MPSRCQSTSGTRKKKNRLNPQSQLRTRLRRNHLPPHQNLPTTKRQKNSQTIIIKLPKIKRPHDLGSKQCTQHETKRFGKVEVL